MLVAAINKEDHYIGNRTATINVIIYEDYECEYCEEAFGELKELTEAYKEEVCFVFRHFPFIRMHPHAELAALVVEACSLQNKFIEAHDLIFKNQEFLEYGLGSILHLLEKNYSVSIDKLNKDLQKAEVRRKLNKDIESGARCVIKNTPAIFINGERYTDDVKFSALDKEIKHLINELESNSS